MKILRPQTGKKQSQNTGKKNTQNVTISITIVKFVWISGYGT